MEIASFQAIRIVTFCTASRILFGDGSCTVEYNTMQCGWDGGDCSIVDGFPDCRTDNPALIGDEKIVL